MVVTFDFDDTLLWKRYVRDEDGEIEDVVVDGPNPEGLGLLRQAIRDGHEVHIVTTRYEKMRNDTIEWLGKWKVLDGIEKIHFTNGQLKRDTLARIGSRLHHDDDEEELENLPPGCRGVLLFPHPSQRMGTQAVTESQLRRLVREVILTEAIKVGDVKQALGYVKSQKLKRAGQEVGKIATKAGGKALIGVLTGGLSDRIKDVIDFSVEAGEIGADTISSLYPALMKLPPKEKESHPLWDKLTIDPDTAAIVDDSIEDKFLKSLEVKIAGLSDDDELPDADEQLADWLKDEFSGAHVTK